MSTATFTPDPDGYAETFIAKYDLNDHSAEVIRNYQRAIFNYVMAKRDGDYTLADRLCHVHWAMSRPRARATMSTT